MNSRTQPTPTAARLAKSAVIVFIAIAAGLVPLEAQGAESKKGISGKVYFNWTYDADPDAAGYNEFTFTRLYLSYGKNLSESIKITLTTDILNNGTPWVAYQKYAYLTAKLGKGEVFIGLQGMNIFNITESNWGYRFLAKSSMDAHKFASSADMGLGYAATFAEKVHLHLTVTNGKGYKYVENDKYKKLAAQAVFGEKSLASHSGFNAGAAFSFEPYEFGIDMTESISVLTVFGAFATESLRIGGEFDRKIDSGKYTQQIIAAYLDYHISAIHKMHVNVFGRVEIYDKNIDEPGDELSILAGLSISPVKTLHIAPTIQIGELASGDLGLSALQLNFEFKF